MTEASVGGRARGWMWGLAPVLAWVIGVFPARGDIGIDVKLSHSKFVQFEPVAAIITLHNDSNVPVTISERSDGTARFSMRVVNGMDEPVERINLRSVVRRRKIEPGEKVSVMADLDKYFDMSRTGMYTVQAMVEASGLRYESMALGVEILSGLPLASQTRSLPWDQGRLRRYQLSYVTREDAEILFISVDEEGGRVHYGVFELGPLLRFFEPVLDVDKSGRITVVHQSQPQRYTRSELESLPDGVRLVNQASYSNRSLLRGGSSSGDTGAAETGK